MIHEGLMRRHPTSENRISVRSSIALAGALAVALVSSSTASAQEKLSVRLDFLPYGAHAPFYLAQEKGWFKENGVEPTIEDGTGTTTTVQLVGAGKYDVGYAGFVSAMVAREKGVPVKAVAGVLRKSDLGIVVDEKSSIFKPKDLEGKKIYYSPASVETLFIDSYFKSAGVDKSKVDLTSVDIAAKVSTYLGGGGDGMFVPVPIYTIRKNIPRLSRGLLFSDAGLPLPGVGLIANETVIREKPKAIAGFVAALQKAWAGIQDGSMTDEAVQALLKNRPKSKLDPEYVRQQLEAMVPYLDTAATKGKPLFWQSPEDWAAGIKYSEQAGVIKAGTKPEEYFTNDFVPKAK
jgi:NitT/TauT family transport system substrate-binding protein